MRGLTIILAVAALAGCHAVTPATLSPALGNGGCPSPQRTMVAAEEGAGQPIVMLGGVLSGGGPTPLSERLASRRRVIRLQHLAAEAGVSGQIVEVGYGVHTERCAMLATLGRVVGNAPVDLVGYSYGGVIALDFALHHPQRVRSLTLIEPPAGWILSEEELQRPEYRRGTELSTRIKRRLPTDSEAAAFICVAFGCPPGDELQHVSQLPFWPTVVKNRAALSAIYANAEHRPSPSLLQSLKAPVLYVSGTGTGAYNAGVNAAFRRELPRAHYLELPGGHAAPTVSAKPLAEAILEFTTAANAGPQQTPLDVRMTPANPAAATALQHPRVAAALEARMRRQRALVAGDADAFGSGFARDAVVNGPTNTVVTAADATRRSRAGALNYKYMHTSIEYAAPRREDEVVFMGEETYEFKAGVPQAGKTLRRRFTDLYQNVDGKWLLSLRHATIISDN